MSKNKKEKEEKIISFIRYSPLERNDRRKFFVVYPNLRAGYPGNFVFVTRKKESNWAHGSCSARR